MSGPSIPYAGNATSFPPNVNVLGGSDTPGSTVFNTTSEGTLDRTAYLAAMAPRVGNNWLPASNAQVLASTYYTAAAAWDAKNAIWVIGFLDTGSSSKLQMYTSNGIDPLVTGAYAQQQGGGSTGLANTGAQDWSAVCADPTTATKYWAFTTSSTAIHADFAFANTWTNSRTLTGLTAVTGVSACSFGSVVIYALGSSNVGTVRLSTFNGSSWIDFSPSVAQHWVLCPTNPALVLAVPKYTTGASVSYYTSPDGLIWTTRSATFITGSFYCVGVVWSAAAQLWIAATTDATHAKFYSSPDAIAWTQIGSGTITANLNEFGCGANGLVCALEVNGDGTQSIIFSPDSGATWYAAGGYPVGGLLGPGSGVSGNTASRVASGPNGVLAFNNTYLRWTAVVGLPAVSL